MRNVSRDDHAIERASMAVKSQKLDSKGSRVKNPIP